MRVLPAILLGGSVLSATLAPATAGDSPSRIKAYYTRLPFDDHGFTGKYADIVVALPQRGQFVFSREFGYQPYWLAAYTWDGFVPLPDIGVPTRYWRHSLANEVLAGADLSGRRTSVPTPMHSPHPSEDEIFERALPLADEARAA